MPEYILRARPTSAGLRDPDWLWRLEQHMIENVRGAFPHVKWLADFFSSPREYVEIFSAPDPETAERVAEAMRRHGDMQAAVWPLAGWTA